MKQTFETYFFIIETAWKIELKYILNFDVKFDLIQIMLAYVNSISAKWEIIIVFEFQFDNYDRTANENLELYRE